MVSSRKLSSDEVDALIEGLQSDAAETNNSSPSNQENVRPFKVAKNVEMMVIDGKTGKKADFGSGEIIIESFKKNTIEKNILNGNDNLITTKNNILKFY